MTGSMDTDKQLMQDMLYRVRECNEVPKGMKSSLMKFVVDGIPVGKVTKSVAELLCNTPSSSSSDPVFEIVESKTDSNVELTLSESAGRTPESRTDAVMSIMTNLKSQGIITGWRDELYPLSTGFYEEPLLFVERAASPLLGMLSYGVHINGIVKADTNGGDDGKEEKMWIARRSLTKSKYPGMTDQLVAGGQPAGLGLMENVIKECQEEAGIPEEVAKKGIQAAGAVTYEYMYTLVEELQVVDRVVLFNYDLELPANFEPKVVDGEVQEFFQWGVQEQFASMAKDFKDPMKPNCYLCVIDYLLRKGEISPEVPGYLDLLRELRSGDCA